MVLRNVEIINNNNNISISVKSRKTSKERETWLCFILTISTPVKMATNFQSESSVDFT